MFKKFILIVLLSLKTVLFAQNYSIFYDFDSKKYFLANNESKKILPQAYDDIKFNNNEFIVKLDGKYWTVDDSGKILRQFINNQNLNSNYPKKNNVDRIISQKNKKYGVVDLNNNTIIPFEFNSEIVHLRKDAHPNMPFKNDVFFASRTEFIENNLVIKNGLFDRNGKIIFKVGEYDEIRIPFTKDSLIAVSKNGKFGYVNNLNEVIIPFQYENAYAFKYGMGVVKHEGFYRVINSENKLISPKYSDYGYPLGSINIISPNLIEIYSNSSNNKMLDNKFKPIFEGNIKLLRISGLYELSMYIDKRNKYGIMDGNGNIIINPNYDYVRPILKDREIFKLENTYFFIFKLDKKYGVINNLKEIIIPNKYDFIFQPNGANYFLIKKDGFWGVMDYNFNII